MPQSLGDLTPFTAFLPLKLLSTSTATATATTTTANRWTLIVIGGTAIAAIAFGGSATVLSESVHTDSHSKRTRSQSRSGRRNTKLVSATQSENEMFSIICYLAEKISSIIPWRTTASALENSNINRDRRQGIEGLELENRAGTGDESVDQVEVEKLRQLLEEARSKEDESAKALEEMETLRGEVERLKRELEGTREGTTKQQASEAEKPNGASDPEKVDPLSVAHDGTSEAEVISLVEALNTEIMDLAQAVVHAFANTSRLPPPLPSEDMPDEIKEAVAGTTEILGVGVVELLQEPQRSGASVDEGTVRMALKASMAAYMHWIISSWYFENPEDEHLLSEIYARVRETEDQTTSGRWRALTRVHLQRMLAEAPDLTVYMVDAFVNILLTAGWHNDAAALQEYLVETFGQMIGNVLEKAKQLNKVIGEEVVNCDLEALYIAPDIAFNQMTMEPLSQPGAQVESRSEDRVLCTTKLGLVKAEKRPGKVGEWDEAVLLKPTVILQSSVFSGL